MSTLVKIYTSVIEFLKSLFYIVFSIFCIWVLFCSFDVQSPIEDLTISVQYNPDSKKATVLSKFIRTRQCALKRTINITDSKGQIVLSETVERLVNGNIGWVNQEDIYKLADNINPGIARYNLYLSWECPYNIVHTSVKPITLEYEVSFNVKEH